MRNRISRAGSDSLPDDARVVPEEPTASEPPTILAPSGSTETEQRDSSTDSIAAPKKRVGTTSSPDSEEIKLPTEATKQQATKKTAATGRRGERSNPPASSGVPSDITFPIAPRPAYETHGGAYYVGDSLQLLTEESFKGLQGKVQLVITSPPYPLNAKKSYGNLSGDKYLAWLESLASILSNLLTDDGSIVWGGEFNCTEGKPVGLPGMMWEKVRQASISAVKPLYATPR